jgi:hypothetical protein
LRNRVLMLSQKPGQYKMCHAMKTEAIVRKNKHK